MTPFTLTVVVPCLDEAENIRAVYEEIVAELDGYDALDILFVDDGSTDTTLMEIKVLAAADPRVGYLSFTRNFGLEAAFSAGYRYARQDWILHLDADLQFPPAEARRMVVAATAGGYDAVFGVRVDRKDKWVRRLASWANDLIARRLLRIEIPSGATTFRLVRTSLARRIVELNQGTPYFLATVPRLTSAWTTVPTEHRARQRGEAKVSVRGLARHAMELFMSYSDRPMAAASGFLVVAMLLCVIGGLTALFGAVTAALELIGVAGAVGFAALAVTARYLVHIAHAQRCLPKYLVRESNLAIEDADLLRPGSTTEVPR